MKYVAILVGSGGPSSGVKETREEVERWLENQLLTTKATNGYIFEAVAQMVTEPRTTKTIELQPTEENTRPEPKPEPECAAHHPKPLFPLKSKLNGSDPDYTDDVGY